MKNKKLIGQKCECFFTGAAMLCPLHAEAPRLLAALKFAVELIGRAECDVPKELLDAIASAERAR